ncbi:diaminopimelate decarboxylase [Bacillus toyonensis]|uniref:diaminopimelate decarboxylase n=1 Tax=Bacillus cereus group TaxID=86661 RepID=UPI0018D18292|nr:diaminopimelate decarboxylase [Bacillus toyonensis]MBH0357134.1 diaminopimelate decarboxylase [Bacillus toyonensis biovar Thuringiensis]
MNDLVLECIARKHGTPIYIYDGEGIVQKYKNMKKSLDKKVDIFYSLKTNPALSIAGLYNQLGAGVEVASGGEMLTAFKAGYSNKNIIYSGPGKTADELKMAINGDLYCIIAESYEEILLIENLSKELNKSKVSIGIRINPDFNSTTSSIQMGGKPSQFGVEEIDLERCLKYIKISPYLKFVGIHVYIGTQILDAEKILMSMKYTLDLVDNIKKEFHLNFEMIDLGGGFGMKYFDHEEELDFLKFSSRFNELIKSHRKKHPNARYIIESGRYLMGENGYYVTKVNYVKESRGSKFVIVDGGLNHHQAATFRGRLMKNNYPIRIIKDKKTKQLEKVSIVGPLCTPEDCIARNIVVERVEKDDLVCIEKSGAYGLTYSPVLFLSHEIPSEVLCFKNEHYVIREKFNKGDFIKNQKLINYKEIKNEFFE